MRILHVAPFDASRYPPLINTIHVTAKRGVESVIVASAPVTAPQVLGDALVLDVARPLSGKAQLRRLIQQTFVTLRHHTADLLIAHNSMGLLAACIAAPSKSRPLIYHCHDFDAEGGGWDARVRRALERTGSLRAHEMWVPATERLTIARSRGLHSPARVVRNCPIKLDSLPAKGRLRTWASARSNIDPQKMRIVVRHGRIGSAHCIKETVEAMVHLPESTVFVVIGDGDREYINTCLASARRLGLTDRVLFHPFVPHSELVSLLVDADVAMCLYAATDTNTATPAPNKVFESMATGVPVVVARGSSVADDVSHSGSGLAIDLGDERALASALGRLIADDAFAHACRRSARAAHLEMFNYETELAPTRLGRLLESRTAERAARPWR
jgi:glycosyltransferase involved in cell wall biosynthesis